MVRSALESVNVFTSWLVRPLLLTSMRFDSSLVTKADVAQMARAADLYSAGRGFESLHRLKGREMV